MGFDTHCKAPRSEAGSVLDKFFKIGTACRLRSASTWDRLMHRNMLANSDCRRRQQAI